MKTDKNNLKDKFRKLRNSLLVKDKEEKSKRIAQRVFSLKEFRKARIIMFYFSFEGEVRTEEMIEEA